MKRSATSLTTRPNSKREETNKMPAKTDETDPEEYYQDLLPTDEEGSLPTEIEEAFGRLNEAIRACRTPLSWEPGKFAVKLEEER